MGIGSRSVLARSAASEPSRATNGNGWHVVSRVTNPDAALALMFASGGTLGVLYLAMPHWYVARPLLILAASLAAIAFAPLIWLSRRRLGSRGRNLVLSLGTIATTVAVLGVGAGPSSMSTAYFYFWVVLYAAAFSSSVAAVGHLALAGALYAAALAVNRAPEFISQWMLAMSALTVIVFFLATFASKVRQGAEALTSQALHDTLTGLANRALFFNKVEDALSRPLGQRDQVAIVYLDIDDFKTVNDSLGDPAGDRLLTSLASCLGSLTHAGDTLARLGGDEFAILLQSGPQPQAAQAMAELIAESLRTPFQVCDTEITVSVSIGISVAESSNTTCEELLRKADLAMYLAKKNGTGRFEIVRPGMLDDALKRLALITDLRHALDDSQLEVFYQPIVGARDAVPVGAEALVRWHHPRRGLVTPDKLVAAAESTGLIVEIGGWVLNEACRQAQAWRQDGTTDDAFYVSVNMSPRQLAEPAVIEEVQGALRCSGLPPSALVLEITETSMMMDFQTGLARLNAFKDLGVRIAVDDFGTGYSSLNRLQSLPLDIVKIDKSFVDQIVPCAQDRALVQSIIDVTHALGMTSTAEGVEDPEQYVALQLLGCDAIQGYLLARPAVGASTARTLKRLANEAASAGPGNHDPEASRAPGLVMD
jgi:diguanylate cyclase (GGDEF)-like protein